MSEFLNKLLGFILLCVSLPLWAVLYAFVKATSKGSFIFRQNRVGKDKKIFTLYKIRTMVWNAEQLKKKYRHLNEVEKPMFKIKDDPRYTKVGKVISYLGFDELPQLINVLRGEMSLVGPRPLPVEEAMRIPEKYRKRFWVLPGITSPWVVQGSHRVGFNRWMELDLEYVRKRSFFYDITIVFLTVNLVLKLLLLKVMRRQEE